MKIRCVLIVFLLLLVSCRTMPAPELILKESTRHAYFVNGEKMTNDSVIELIDRKDFGYKNVEYIATCKAYSEEQTYIINRLREKSKCGEIRLIYSPLVGCSWGFQHLIK